MTTSSQPGDRAAIDAEFDRALRSVGQDYLQAEHTLRAGSHATASRLREIAAAQADDYPRFVATTLADWIDAPVDETAAAMASLSELEASRRATPSVAPRPDVIELLLDRRFGARIAPHLALRLTKERWPPWKILGILLYLKREHVAATASAVARYAWTAPLPLAAALARETVVACVGDVAAATLLAQTHAELVRTGAIPPAPR